MILKINEIFPRSTKRWSYGLFGAIQGDTSLRLVDSVSNLRFDLIGGTGTEDVICVTGDEGC